MTNRSMKTLIAGLSLAAAAPLLFTNCVIHDDVEEVRETTVRETVTPGVYGYPATSTTTTTTTVVDD